MKENSLKIKNVKEILFFILGLFIFLDFIYIRFIYQRLPKELLFIKDGEIKYIFVVCVLWVCSTLIILYINIKLTFNIPFKIRNNIFTRFSIRLHEVIEISLSMLNKYLVVIHLENPQKAFGAFTIKFLNLISRKPKGYILFWTSQAPFIALPFLFTYDVFTNFEIKYFYKGLILLVIPFLISIILYQLKHFYRNVDAQVYDFLNISFKKTHDDIILEHISFKDGHTAEECGSLSYWAEQMWIHYFLSKWLQYYTDVTNDYKPKIMIFCYTIYLIDWTYVILKNEQFFQLFF